MRRFNFWKSRRNRIVIIVCLIIILGGIGLAWFLISHKQDISDSSSNNVYISDYIYLLKNKGSAVVYLYAGDNQYDYNNAQKTVDEMNHVFNTNNILLVPKMYFSKSDAAKINKTSDYYRWKDTDELVLIKDGIITKTQNLDNSMPINGLIKAISQMAYDNDLINHENIVDKTQFISLNDYLTMLKSRQNYYLLIGTSINDYLVAKVFFYDHNFPFYYLDYKGLSATDRERFNSSNIRFLTFDGQHSAVAYIFDENNLELSNNVFATDTISNFINKISSINDEIDKTSLNQYLITRDLNLYDLPDTSILDFATYTDYNLKATMVLDKMDYIDYITTINDYGGAVVSKDLFDGQAKALFGDKIVIDTGNLGSLSSGDSCATWTYNVNNASFERGTNECGGDEQSVDEMIDITFRETSSEYILQSKIAHIDYADSKVYADREHSKLVGEFSTEAHGTELDDYLQTLTNKLYSYKYTFEKTTTGYYFKSYEVIK
jgi:hypothetical protein